MQMLKAATMMSIALGLGLVIAVSVAEAGRGGGGGMRGGGGGGFRGGGASVYVPRRRWRLSRRRFPWRWRRLRHARWWIKLSTRWRNLYA